MQASHLRWRSLRFSKRAPHTAQVASPFGTNRISAFFARIPAERHASHVR